MVVFRGFLVILSAFMLIGLIVATWKAWFIGDARVLVDSALLWTAGAVVVGAIYFSSAALLCAIARLKRKA